MKLLLKNLLAGWLFVGAIVVLAVGTADALDLAEEMPDGTMRPVSICQEPTPNGEPCERPQILGGQVFGQEANDEVRRATEWRDSATPGWRGDNVIFDPLFPNQTHTAKDADERADAGEVPGAECYRVLLLEASGMLVGHDKKIREDCRAESKAWMDAHWEKVRAATGRADALDLVEEMPDGTTRPVSICQVPTPNGEPCERPQMNIGDPVGVWEAHKKKEAARRSKKWADIREANERARALEEAKRKRWIEQLVADEAAAKRRAAKRANPNHFESWSAGSACKDAKHSAEYCRYMHDDEKRAARCIAKAVKEDRQTAKGGCYFANLGDIGKARKCLAKFDKALESCK